MTATRHEWAPARVSATVALVTTLTVVGALLWQFGDVRWPVAFGAVGAVLFPLGCWLLSDDEPSGVARAAVSLCTLPVGLGLLGSVAGGALVLSAAAFPVEDGALVSVSTLLVAGQVGVIFGCVLALLGVTLGVRNVLAPVVLARYTTTAFLTALVPGTVAVAIGVEAVLFGADGPRQLANEFLTAAWLWLSAGSPTVLPVAGLLFVLALALVSVLAATIVLPVAVVVDDPARLRRLRRTLTAGSAVVIVLVPVAFWAELASASERSEPAYGTVEALSSVRPLRFGLLSLAALALVATVSAALARWLARHATDGFVRVAGPLAGGTVLTLAAALIAVPVYDRLLELVLEPFPPETAGRVEALAVEAAGFYGEELFAVSLAFVLVTATLCAVVALRLVRFAGYLSAETSGFSLASAGLFVAVVAAGTVGTPTWLVLGGVLASLLVWDSGRYGTTLGREVGSRTTTRGTELVHVAGTALVGLAGALAAFALASRAEAVLATPEPTTPIALAAVTVGIVCLAAAIR